MKDIIDRLIDDSFFREYKADYKTLICGYARIDGWSVIIANQKKYKK